MKSNHLLNLLMFVMPYAGWQMHRDESATLPTHKKETDMYSENFRAMWYMIEAACGSGEQDRDLIPDCD